jgi:hypothetical protein
MNFMRSAETTADGAFLGTCKSSASSGSLRKVYIINFMIVV